MSDKLPFRLIIFPLRNPKNRFVKYTMFPFIPSHPQIFKFPYSTIFHYLPFSHPVPFPKEAIFHQFFTISSTDENGPNGRIKNELNYPRKVNEKERKNQRKQKKMIEKYEREQGGIWELLTLPEFLFGVPQIDS